MNTSRIYLERFLSEAAHSLEEGSLVLDAGAGDCRYRHLFPKVRYESADFCQVDKQYGDVTYICDLSAIPVEDCRYDAVICTQVLEHLTEPQAVLNELFRVLKSQGKLFLTAPFYYEEHEKPYDYFRYTRYGLTRLLHGAGFSVVRMDWLEGYYGTLAYQLRQASKALSLKSSDYGGGVYGIIVVLFMLFLKPLFHGLSSFFSHLDLSSRQVSAGHPKNYMMIAEKRPSNL